MDSLASFNKGSRKNNFTELALSFFSFPRRAWERISYGFLRWRMGTRRKATSTKLKSCLKDARFSDFNVP